ncbi:hypothetical protein D7026_13075 [Salinivibrio sp. VYel7]|nr:hypothetical protein [Salinivibrio sp. VYel7]
MPARISCKAAHRLCPLHHMRSRLHYNGAHCTLLTQAAHGFIALNAVWRGLKLLARFSLCHEARSQLAIYSI